MKIVSIYLKITVEIDVKLKINMFLIIIENTVIFEAKSWPNVLPMSTICHNQPLIPSHFNIQNHNMCHGTIGSNLIKTQSQPHRKSGTL
jgi:hypothetical protein